MAKVVNSQRWGATASSLLRKRAPKRRKSSQREHSAPIAHRQSRSKKHMNFLKHHIATRKKLGPRKAISALLKSISFPSSDASDWRTSALTRLQESRTNCSIHPVNTPTHKQFRANFFDGQFGVAI